VFGIVCGTNHHSSDSDVAVRLLHFFQKTRSGLGVWSNTNKEATWKWEYSVVDIIRMTLCIDCTLIYQNSSCSTSNYRTHCLITLAMLHPVVYPVTSSYISVTMFFCFMLFFHIFIYWLVVSTPLKNMKVKWDDYIPNIWNNHPNVPNHQPVYSYIYVYTYIYIRIYIYR